jgi:hypothetical protein
VPYKILYGNYDWNKNYKGLRVQNWEELEIMIKNINKTITNNKLTKININESDGIKRWEN